MVTTPTLKSTEHSSSVVVCVDRFNFFLISSNFLFLNGEKPIMSQSTAMVRRTCKICDPTNVFVLYIDTCRVQNILGQSGSLGEASPSDAGFGYSNDYSKP